MPSEPLASLHDRPPRRALADLTRETRAAWRTRYLFDEGAELRVLGLLERVEAAMRSTGSEVTIRTLWIHLADRCVGNRDVDLRAAAALAGMAAGIV